MSSQPHTLFPGNTPDIVAINNHIRQIFVDVQIPDDIRPDWNPPRPTPNIPNTCNNINNQARNTNEDCLRQLINNCQIGTTNQNNTINHNNCNAILNYTREYIERVWTRIINQNTPILAELNRGNRPNNANIVTRNSNVTSRLRPIERNLRNLTCTAATTTPAPPVVCCNNIINCYMGDCINVVQLCKQTTNGEVSISNATQCSQSRCPINNQRCLAGVPGAGTFNWVCQNNQWTREPRPPPTPAPPPPPPPAPAPTPTTPAPTPTTPAPTPTTPAPAPAPTPTTPAPPRPTPAPAPTPTTPAPPRPTPAPPPPRPTPAPPPPRPTTTPAPRFTPTQQNASTNNIFFIIASIVVMLLVASSFYFFILK